MKLIVAAAVLLGAVGVVVWMGVVEGSIPVLGIRQAKAEAAGKLCRIDKGKVHSIERTNPLLFTIGSEDDAALLLSVEAPTTSPDNNFKVGASVSVKGQYDAQAQRFNASEVTTACPSKYEASKAGKAAGPSPRAAPLPEKAP
jgi:cytochrome c-type biogenesis protein CcmE